VLIQLKPKHHSLGVLTIFQRGAVFHYTLKNSFRFQVFSVNQWLNTFSAINRASVPSPGLSSGRLSPTQLPDRRQTGERRPADGTARLLVRPLLSKQHYTNVAFTVSQISK